MKQLTVCSALVVSLIFAGCGDDNAATTVTKEAATVTETVATSPATTAEPAEVATVESDSAEGGTEGRIGNELTLPTDALSIRLSSLKRGVQPDDASDNYLLSEGKASPATHEFVKIRVRATNDGSDSTFFWGFTLVDSKGQRYKEIDQTPAVFEPHATGEDLQAGDAIRGVAGFVIPKKAKIKSVRYPSVAGDEEVKWTVDR